MHSLCLPFIYTEGYKISVKFIPALISLIFFSTVLTLQNTVILKAVTTM